MCEHAGVNIYELFKYQKMFWKCKTVSDWRRLRQNVNTRAKIMMRRGEERMWQKVKKRKRRWSSEWGRKQKSWGNRLEGGKRSFDFMLLSVCCLFGDRNWGSTWPRELLLRQASQWAPSSKIDLFPTSLF